MQSTKISAFQRTKLVMTKIFESLQRNIEKDKSLFIHDFQEHQLEEQIDSSIRNKEQFFSQRTQQSHENKIEIAIQKKDINSQNYENKINQTEQKLKKISHRTHFKASTDIKNIKSKSEIISTLNSRKSFNQVKSINIDKNKIIQTKQKQLFRIQLRQKSQKRAELLQKLKKIENQLKYQTNSRRLINPESLISETASTYITTPTSKNSSLRQMRDQKKMSTNLYNPSRPRQQYLQKCQAAYSPIKHDSAYKLIQKFHYQKLKKHEKSLLQIKRKQSNELEELKKLEIQKQKAFQLKRSRQIRITRHKRENQGYMSKHREKQNKMNNITPLTYLNQTSPEQKLVPEILINQFEMSNFLPITQQLINDGQTEQSELKRIFTEQSRQQNGQINDQNEFLEQKNNENQEKEEKYEQNQENDEITGKDEENEDYEQQEEKNKQNEQKRGNQWELTTENIKEQVQVKS